MATVKFLLQNTNSNIYVRFSISRSIILKRKSGYTINPKDWSKVLAQPIQKSNETKNLKSKLDKLASYINDSYNIGVSNGSEFNGEWLQDRIDIFNNKKQVVELDILTNYIQKYIDEAPYKENQKKETGLSAGRIKNLKLFKNTIERYEKEILKNKSILIKDINLQFVEKFKMWLFNQKYSVNYVGKNIANIKTICLDAFKNDIETSTQLKNIKVVSENKTPDQIITLSDQEQQQIKDTILLREALDNARKWLLLGCLIGQRGGDLLNITTKSIKELNGLKIIELRQQKTGKLVAIPLLPDAIEVIESGFPYKISLARFNEYIKDVCEAAKINEPTTGKIKVTSRNPLEIKTKPKFKFITSHVCRRSFATNFYGRIPTPILMNITAHGTEKVFLNYIGKTTYDNAFQMVEYFSKLAPKEKTFKLEVVREAN
jgi:integrase